MFKFSCQVALRRQQDQEEFGVTQNEVPSQEEPQFATTRKRSLEDIPFSNNGPVAIINGQGMENI